MIYRVSYHSLTASYDPKFIEADSELEARLRFAGTAFSRNELGMIEARPVSAKEIQRQLGVTYKCAWRIAHQIRQLMGRKNTPKLSGKIEIDETCF